MFSPAFHKYSVIGCSITFIIPYLNVGSTAKYKFGFTCYPRPKRMVGDKFTFLNSYVDA